MKQMKKKREEKAYREEKEAISASIVNGVEKNIYTSAAHHQWPAKARLTKTFM